jgi:hypothetical protein
MINGFRYYFQPGVVANVHPFLDDLRHYNTTLSRFDDASPVLLTTNDDPTQWGTQLTWGTAPSFTGIPNEDNWSFTSNYDSAAGGWYLNFADENVLDGSAVVPFSIIVPEESFVQQVQQLLMNRYPANPPIPNPTGYVGLTLGGTLTNPLCTGLQVEITNEGSLNHWYDTAGVAKYGWVTEVYEDGSNGEFHWINFVSQRVFLKLN